MDTVSQEVFNKLLDRDYKGTLARADLSGLEVAMHYGASLPQGREFGDRAERAAWLSSERAKRVRAEAARRVLAANLTEGGLFAFVRGFRKRHRLHGYGPLLRNLVKRWHRRAKGGC